MVQLIRRAQGSPQHFHVPGQRQQATAEEAMSSNDTLAHLLHAMGHGDKLVETLLHGGHGSPFEGMGKGLLDRATMSDRRFWTGAAIGAAAILAYAAIVSKRSEPLAGGTKADGAEKRMNGRH